jgi:drug/metabolite transporter (DMT)-like permease
MYSEIGVDMWARGIVGVVLCLVGAVWVAQGTDVLHGSGMSGQGQWAVVGGALFLVGVAVLVREWRARGHPRSTR